MNEDWSISYILIKKYLEMVQLLMNEGKYADAQELTFSIDAETTKLRNYCWKESK